MHLHEGAQIVLYLFFLVALTPVFGYSWQKFLMAGIRG